MKKLKDIKEKFDAIANETRSTCAWLAQKDDLENYQNARDAASEVSLIYKNPQKLAAKVAATALAGCLTGSMVAYKKTFWENYFNDMQQTFTAVTITKQDERTDPILSEFADSLNQAHEDAPYKKYALVGAASLTTIMLLSNGMGAVVTARRRREKYGTQESDEHNSNHEPKSLD